VKMTKNEENGGKWRKISENDKKMKKNDKK
jgi:hypothetical protein